MTLQKAFELSQKLKLRVRHQLMGAEYLEFDELVKKYDGNIPMELALSNTWELEPRMIRIREDDFRGCLIPTLRKFLPQSKLEECLNELADVFFQAVQ